MGKGRDGEAHAVVPVQIGLLGPVQVRVGRVPRHVGGPTAQLVLAALALQSGRTITVDRLVDTLWDTSPASAANTLAGIMSRLRRVVAPATITRRGPAYVLDLPPDAVDVHRFEQHGEEGLRVLRDGRADEALALLDRALGMWRGQPFEGLGSRPDIDAARVRLLQRRTDLLIGRGHALLLAGRPQDAAAHLRVVVEDAPGREHAWALLGRALYADGRQVEALEVVRNASDHLRRRAGLDPSPELTGLERAILHHSPALAVTGTTPAARSGSATAFFGRRSEMDTLRRHVRARRHVVVVGAPGVGKTRLVHEAVAGLGEDRPVALVTVRGSAGGAARLESDVLTALGVPVAGVAPPCLDSLGELLARRSDVLVVDGAERQPAAVERVIAALVRSESHITLVLTSREAIEVPGASTIQLGPLPVLADSGDPGPAVHLYLDRAATVLPISEAQPDMALAQRTCALLDGLPLAIEVATGLLRTFDAASLPDLLTRDRGLLLTDGNRANPLGLALTESWDALSDTSRLVLRCASALAGDFSLTALSGLVSQACPAGAGPDVARELHTLVAHSLVQVRSVACEGQRRYRVLDVVATFVLAQQGSDEGLCIQAAHAAWVAAEAGDIAARVQGPDQRGELDRLDRLLPNADRAVSHAVVRDPDTAAAIIGHLGWPMFLRTNLTLLHRWMEALGTAWGEARFPPDVALAACLLAYVERDLPTARDHASVVATAPEPDLARLGSFWLAWLDSLLGASSGGDDALGRVAAAAAAAGDAAVRSYAESARGWVRLRSGDAEGARELGLGGHPLAEATGHDFAIGFNAHLRGTAAAALGLLDEAAAAQREALRRSVAIGHRTGMIDHICCLALIGVRLGRYDDGARVLGAVRALLPTTGLAPDFVMGFSDLCELVGGAEFESAMAEGARLPLEDVIALSLALASVPV